MQEGVSFRDLMLVDSFGRSAAAAASPCLPHLLVHVGDHSADDRQDEDLRMSVHERQGVRMRPMSKQAAALVVVSQPLPSPSSWPVILRCFHPTDSSVRYRPHSGPSLPLRDRALAHLRTAPPFDAALACRRCRPLRYPQPSPLSGTVLVSRPSAQHQC